MAGIEVAKKPSQVSEVTAHLEKSIHAAKAEFSSLRERLSPVVMQIPPQGPAVSSVPKGGKVPLAELLESFACMVDALVYELQDTNSGLEL